MKTVIVVVMNGFVIPGILEDNTDEGVTLLRAASIWRYGCTRGLGQLADGPTDKTLWGPIAARTFVPRDKVLFMFDAPGWEGKL